MNYINRYQKEKKVIGLTKGELGGKTMTKFAGLRAKSYSNLIDDGSEYKKVNVINKCVINKIKFENYKIHLETTQLEIKNYPEKN